MQFRLLFISLFVFFGTNSFLQGLQMHISNSISDCYGAVEVLDYDNDSRVQFPGNMGQYDEFQHFAPALSEVNSVWLRLEPNMEGSFGFDIYTENNVDFGFYLFKAKDNSFCEHLVNEMVEPILYSNSSNQRKGTSSNSDGTNDNPHLQVGYEDIFYLMIHTNSSYKGKVRLTYHRKGEVRKTLSVIQDFRTNNDENFVRVRIRDSESGEPVEANIIFTGLRRDDVLFMGTDFIFPATFEKELFIETNTPGYFLYYKEIDAKQLIGKNSEILIELERLAPGKKLELEDIKFEPDSDVFLPIAMPALKRLLDFLAVNDGIVVEIQGHVNAPDVKNSARVQHLSQSRARSVKKFLKDNGIRSDRLVAVGYGNLEMKFPEPEEDAQEEANRRVEIMILDSAEK